MTIVEMKLEARLLRIRCASADLLVDRQLSESDFTSFSNWSTSYVLALSRESDPETMLAIGRRIHEWVDGGERCLERVLDSVEPPLVLEFSTARAEPKDRPFLDAPWELLADGQGHWAQRHSLAYCPVRRFGKRGDSPKPSPYKLSALFMAAAPAGVVHLSFEDEEVAILKATRETGMQLVVEESGTLQLLRTRVAEENPDVVHVSCHGRLKPEPALLLEDEFGDASPASAQDLVLGLAGTRPRLLFLSACQTAMTDDVVRSLVWSLVPSAAPAVVGWAGSVGDYEATQFAGFLYRRLAEGEPLTQATAYARLDLFLPEPNSNALTAVRQSRDWHSARLYLGPTGGGVLATGKRGQRGGSRSKGYYKAFLNRQKQEVPVAAPFEFVGRRREVQSVLREFNKPLGDRKAGVFIHGLGRQGKSSLAARVADRLEPRDYKILVLHGRYDAPAILQVFKDFSGGKEVHAVVEEHIKTVEENPENLQTALVELLEGPCSQVVKDADGNVLQHPVLLIIDDFERALEGQQGGGRHRLNGNYVESIRSTIKAFDQAATESRLLFTSRFQFTLIDGGRELANRLFDLPLAPMQPYESEKQIAAKLKRHQIAATETRRMEQIVETSKGNPGLQDWLFRMALENPETCDRCLENMKGFLENGERVDEQEVLRFLEDLALSSVVKLLSGAQEEVLRASTLFKLPVPEPVIGALARAAGLSSAPDDLARLTALGLWDVYEDSFCKDGSALAIDPLVRPLTRSLNENEQTALAEVVVSDLFNRWGGPGDRNQRTCLHELELARLALLARRGDILLHTAEHAVRWLEEQFAYAEAARLGEAAIACIEASVHSVPLGLRRATAENDKTVGEVQRALIHLDRALQDIAEIQQQGRSIDPKDYGDVLGAHARVLQDVGRPDDALEEFQQALTLLTIPRERAIALGDIARLRTEKGDLDEALKLHQEALVIFNALGDKRLQAITLNDIAGLLSVEGDVDEALVLYRKGLAIFEALGDKRWRAITLGDVARVLTGKGDVDEALKLHREGLAVFEVLGDKRLRAITLTEIARLLTEKGDVDEALKLHQESLAVFEALGDKRTRAITLGDVARLLSAKGEVDEALMLHRQKLLIIEALGDKRSRAITLGDIARLLSSKGEAVKRSNSIWTSLPLIRPWAISGQVQSPSATLAACYLPRAMWVRRSNFIERPW